MQPYQEASEESRRQSELPLKTAGKVAGGALAASQILPFMSSYLPENLAIKGLSKISPRLGQFVQKALRGGKSFEEVKEFMTEKIDTSEASKKQKAAGPNLFESISPPLHQFMTDQISRGLRPSQAAALAYDNFKKDIKKLQKRSGMKIEDLAEMMYGDKAPQANSQSTSLSNPGISGQAALQGGATTMGQNIAGANPQSSSRQGTPGKDDWLEIIQAIENR